MIAELKSRCHGVSENVVFLYLFCSCAFWMRHFDSKPDTHIMKSSLSGSYLVITCLGIFSQKYFSHYWVLIPSHFSMSLMGNEAIDAEEFLSFSFSECMLYTLGFRHI